MKPRISDRSRCLEKMVQRLHGTVEIYLKFNCSSLTEIACTEISESRNLDEAWN